MFPFIFVQQDVKFPMSLDVFDLCSEELQQKLMPARTKFKEIEDKKVEEAAVRQANVILRKQINFYKTDLSNVNRVENSKSLCWLTYSFLDVGCKKLVLNQHMSDNTERLSYFDFVFNFRIVKRKEERNQWTWTRKQD